MMLSQVFIRRLLTASHVAVSQSEGRRTLCNSSSAPWRRCWLPGGRRRSPSCWAGSCSGSPGRRQVSPGLPPADSLALTASVVPATSLPVAAAHCPSHRTCPRPGTWAWCSCWWGRGWWRPWRPGSLSCWGSGACSSGWRGDAVPCLRCEDTWRQRGTCSRRLTLTTAESSPLTWEKGRAWPARTVRSQTRGRTRTVTAPWSGDSTGRWSWPRCLEWKRELTIKQMEMF